MADIEKWITINGAHIPIIKGESKAKAVSNFIKGERAKRNKKVKMVKVEGYKYPIEADYEKRLNKYKSIQKDANKRYDKKEITREQRNRIIDSAHDKYIKQTQTIRGRAKTRDEVEDERFDKYDEYAHNAAKNIRFDNRAKPLSQDELYDRAHAVAEASSMYDMDYKYGKGGTHENKQVSINDKIREARYKMKNTPKAALNSREKALDDYNKAFDKMERANQKWAAAEERYKKYGNGDKSSEYYKKVQDAKANYKKSTKILDEYTMKYSETFHKKRK